MAKRSKRKKRRKNQKEFENFLWFSATTTLFFIVGSIALLGHTVPQLISDTSNFSVELGIVIMCGWLLITAWVIVQFIKEYKKRFK